MEFHVGNAWAVALGDLRRAGYGDVIALRECVQNRPDWARYLDAIAAAVARGADVRWIR